MQEDAAKLREKLGDKAITPEAGELMIPLTPILRQRNWPLLEVSSGGFGGAAAAAALTAAAGTAGGGIGAAAAAAAAAGSDEEDDVDADAWGGDDLDLGGGDEGATPRTGGDDDDEDGGWEMEVRVESRNSIACKYKIMNTAINGCGSLLLPWGIELAYRADVLLHLPVSRMLPTPSAGWPAIGNGLRRRGRRQQFGSQLAL